MQDIEFIKADLSARFHQEAIVALLDGYSSDPMGDGKPLRDEVKENLIPGLRNHPTTLIYLAMSSGAPVGIAVCFLGFSTFAARPLINIHDLYVMPEARGCGVAKRLLAHIEQGARSSGCCKLTLEVLERNTHAKQIYEAHGFRQAAYAGEAGGALFLAKPLCP